MGRGFCALGFVYNSFFYGRWAERRSTWCGSQAIEGVTLITEEGNVELEGCGPEVEVVPASEHEHEVWGRSPLNAVHVRSERDVQNVRARKRTVWERVNL